jgi:hypothetical protein
VLATAAVLVVATVPVGSVAVAALDTAAEPLAATSLTYTDVDVPGATYTHVTGVNALGVIVGYFGDTLGEHGFIDDQGTFTTVDVPGGSGTLLTSINDFGAVTGAYWDSGGVSQHGFLRAADGTFTWLDDPNVVPLDRQGTVPSQVNNAGVVVGYSFRTDLDGHTYPDGGVTSATQNHGFVWQNNHFTTYDAPGSTVADLPDSGTWLRGISRTGDMVGNAVYINDGPPSMAFVVSGRTVRTFVDPTVPINFCGYTEAVQINAVGTIAGNSGNPCAPTHSAWLLTGNSYLYLSHPGAIETVVGSLNDNGVVGGTWTSSDGVDHGFTLTVPSATVTGKVTPSGPFYPGTRFGVRACPSDEPFGSTCVGGTLTTADASGNFVLTLIPGSWTLAGFAWNGGDPEQETYSPTTEVTLASGRATKLSFVLPSQLGSVSGTTKPYGTFPSNTTYGALACPAIEPFAADCADGRTVVADSSSRYSLALPPGSWSVGGIAWSGGNGEAVLSGYQQATLAVGQALKASFIVGSPYGVVIGTVKPSGIVPAGTTYAALACPAGNPLVLTCEGAVLARADTTGRYSLVLFAGAWNVEGVAFAGGSTSTVLTSPTPAVLTVSPRSSTTIAFSIPTPYGVAIGRTRADTAVPLGTTFGAYACRASEPFSFTCSTLAIVNGGSTGTYQLALTPGTWNVAGVVWTAGSSPQRLTSGAVTVNISTGQGANLPDFVVTSPYGVVSGTVTPGASFPSRTTYAALACPAGESLAVTCASANLVMVDSRGNYILALLPGTWQVAGVAFPGGGPYAVLTPEQTVNVTTAQPLTRSFVVPVPTHVTLNSPTAGSSGQPVLLSALLFNLVGNPISGVPVSFTLGSASCTATTDRGGRAVCTLAPTGPPQTVMLVATFEGSSQYSSSTSAAPFAIH